MWDRLYGEAVYLLYRKLRFRKAKKIICPAERAARIAERTVRKAMKKVGFYQI